MKLHLLSVLTTLIFSQQLFAQCEPPAASTCQEQIPLVCNMDGYCGQTIFEEDPTLTIGCNTSAIDLYGMQLIRFIATAEQVTISIHYEDCNGVMDDAGGMQFGMSAVLVIDCPTIGVGSLDCATMNTESGELVISIPDAVPGESYTLVLSGRFGNVCSFDITVGAGADPLPGLIETGDMWEGATVVCKNEEVLYNAPSVENAESYTWALPFGEMVETDFPQYEYLWDESVPPGVYSICVSATNQCGTLNDYACLEVTVQHEVEESIFITVCASDTVIMFGNMYTGPGTYTFLAENSVGCDTLYILEIEVFDVPTVAAEIVHDNGSSNGSIDLTVAGTGGPYTFMWSNGETTEDINGLVAGNYGVGITDVFGCETKAEFVVQMETSTNTLQQNWEVTIAPNPVVSGQMIQLDISAIPATAVQVSFVQSDGVNHSAKLVSFSDTGFVQLTAPDSPGIYQVVLQAGNQWAVAGRIVVLKGS